MFNLNGPDIAFFRAEPYPVMRSQGVSPTTGATYEGRLAAQAALKAAGIKLAYHKYRRGDEKAEKLCKATAEANARYLRERLAEMGIDHPVHVAEGILL